MEKEKTRNVRIGEETWRAAKQEALDQGTSVKRVIEDSVDEYVKE